MESKIVQKNIELASMNREELTSLIAELREPAFRVKQISEWLSRGVKPVDMLVFFKRGNRLAAYPARGGIVVTKTVFALH